MGKERLAITAALSLGLLYGKLQEENHTPKIVKVSQNTTRKNVRKAAQESDHHENPQSEEINSDEFSVEVSADEEGNISTNYNPVTAIADCVESTGAYLCLNTGPSNTICWGNNINGDNAPVNISVTSGFTAEELQGGHAAPRLTVAQGGSSNSENFPLEGEADELSTQHTQACQSAITMLTESAPSSEDTDWSKERDAWEKVTEKTNKLWEDLEEEGYKIKDPGGGQVTVQMGDHSVNISATLKGDLQSVFWVKGPGPNDFHAFDGSEEVMDYLSEIE